MEKLIRKESYGSPKIDFDADTGLLQIEGGSISDDADKFYEPLISWLEAYCKNPQPKTHVKLFFYFTNTRTSKFIYYFLKKLDDMYKKGNDVKIAWQYDEGDEDSMLEGTDYKEMFKVPIKVQCVK